MLQKTVLFEALKRALRENRLPSALLIYTTPWEISLSELEEFCFSLLGDHSFYKEWSVRVLSAEKEGVGVEKVREFIEWAQLSVPGPLKIGIIWEAHLLNEIAQNTLLKTLEEPPPSTYFFLVSSLPYLLLDTILSRAVLLQVSSSFLPDVNLLRQKEQSTKARELLNWFFFKKNIWDKESFPEIDKEERLQAVLWAQVFLRDRVIKKVYEEKKPPRVYLETLSNLLSFFPYFLSPSTNLFSLALQVYIKSRKDVMNNG